MVSRHVVRPRASAVAQPMAIILGQHVRVGIEDNLLNGKRQRMSSVDQIKAPYEGDTCGADEIPYLMREESQAPVIASGKVLDEPAIPHS